MSDRAIATKKMANSGNAGDRIREIADQLRQETSLQIKATSRILGAAAQISENHDRLIDQVVEIVEEDLERHTQPTPTETSTIVQLQQQFKTLKQAKSHFGLKANTWASLVDKLSQQTTAPNFDQASVDQRLDTIEHELQTIRTDLSKALTVLKLILEKVS